MSDSERSEITVWGSYEECQNFKDLQFLPEVIPQL